MAEGKFRPLPIEKAQGGLQGIPQALDKIRAGGGNSRARLVSVIKEGQGNQ